MDVVSKIELVPIMEIRPYHRNTRHNEETVVKLVELIPLVGFNVPLVLDRKNVIVKGHSRWKAAIRLGMTKIPCVYTDADEETIKFDRLADNRVQEFSKWDDETLKSELASLNLSFNFDLSGLNFSFTDKPVNQIAPDGQPHRVVENFSEGGDYSDSDMESSGYARERDDDDFITEKDIAATVGISEQDYDEVTCSKCGNVMFIRSR